MGEIATGIWIGVGLFLVVAALKGVGWLMSRLGEIVAGHLHEGLVSSLQASLASYIKGEVAEVVDNRFQTMELRIDEIHRELHDNGGDSLKDAIRRIEARQSKEALERSRDADEMWATLREYGIDRRSGDDG